MSTVTPKRAVALVILARIFSLAGAACLLSVLLLSRVFVPEVRAQGIGNQPGLLLSTTGVAVREDGERGLGSNTYTVRLNSSPTATVTIRPTPTGSNASLITVSPPMLMFNSGNWDDPQTVTVTAVQDDIDQARATDSIQINVANRATSADRFYQDLSIDLTVFYVDDDDSGLVYTPPTLSFNEDRSTLTMTYQVRLRTQPTSGVELTPRSSDTTLATAAGVDVVAFIPDDWNQPQTITVTLGTGVVDDDIDHTPDRTAARITHRAVSTDNNYGGTGGRVIDSTSGVTVRLTDNDTAGVAIAGFTGDRLRFDEDESGSYTVRLTSEPIGDVTITPTIAPMGVATVLPMSLTFTGGRDGNWNDPQEVTVTGMNDNIDNNPDRTATITHTISRPPGAEDSDDGYDTDLEMGETALTVDSVEVTAINDDTAAVELNLTEAQFFEDDGPSQSVLYTIVLGSEPTDDVTVMLGIDTRDLFTAALVPAGSPQPEMTQATSTTTMELTTTGLTFTPSSWNVAQTIIIRPVDVDDDIDHSPDRASVISHTAASMDDNYNGLSIDTFRVTIADKRNETAGVTVMPNAVGVSETDETPDNPVNENRGTYTLVLSTEPINDVIITPSSADDTVATVSGPLTFTPANWNRSQEVTVTGVDDSTCNNPPGSDACGGTRNVQISHAITRPDDAADSDDGYDTDLEMGETAVTVDDVAVTVTDTDTAEIMLSETEVTVDEEGGIGMYTVQLTSQPANPVTVRIASDDPTVATVPPTTLIFIADGSGTNGEARWDDPQTVTVRGANESIDNPSDRTTTITHMAASVDGNFNEDEASLTVIATDNDTHGVTITNADRMEPQDGVSFFDIAEDQGRGTYRVELDSQPTHDVTITPTITDADGHTLTGVVTVSGPLTFTPDNWNRPQTVTVTGVANNIDNGDQRVTITHAATSADTNYAGEPVDSVTLTVKDNETHGVTITNAGGMEPPDGVSFNVAEDGGRGTYRVVLDSQPTHDVTIDVTITPMIPGTTGAVTVTVPLGWSPRTGSAFLMLPKTAAGKSTGLCWTASQPTT